MYKKLIAKINEFEKITLFHHIKPDGDCAFTTLAFYYFLKENFKGKKIKITGFDDFDLAILNQKVNDDFINDSLAIVIDTASLNRIDDRRVINAKYIVKIDHHPALEQYGNLNIVNPKAAATSEIITDMIQDESFKNYKVSRKVCEYLCCAILTDTLSFKTTNTTYNTLAAASFLVKKGKLQISDLNEFLFNKSLDEFNKISKLRNELIVDGKFGYIYLTKTKLKKLNMSAEQAKNNIDCIGNIKDLNVWVFFVEKDHLIDCSLRSKKNCIVNEIAYKFNGGGHKNAAGIKNIDAKMFEKLKSQLSTLANR